jgi:MFS family permease
MMAFFKAVAATKSMNHQNPSGLKTFDKDDSKRLLQHSTSSGRAWNNQETLTNGIATVLDGMSRAVILPFGPILVNRLLISTAAGVDGTTSAANTAMKLSPEDSSKVPFPYALVVMAYIAGRALGYRCFQTFNVPTERLPRIVARISGIVISLYVFTFGSGLQSVSSLVFIRLVAGFLIGTLCAITRDKQNQCLDVSTITCSFPFG